MNLESSKCEQVDFPQALHKKSGEHKLSILYIYKIATAIGDMAKKPYGASVYGKLGQIGAPRYSLTKFLFYIFQSYFVFRISCLGFRELYVCYL